MNLVRSLLPWATIVSCVVATPAHGASVAVSEDDTAFTLTNGVVTARVFKHNGDLASLQYQGEEMLNDKSGHAGAYWSHDTTGGSDLITRVTIDPKSNGGERGEVSVKAISGGIPMGHGPGAAAGGDFPADIEIRYTLGRGDSGIYTYCAFTHRPEYPAATMTEARFAAKLADMFDWMTLDPKRDKPFPKDLHEGDKYIYTTVQFDNRAFGWSSTSRQIGFWLLNPSVEFLSGGPTKVEFLGHRDTTPVAAPIVFNYWRSSHYGGAAVEVGAGEHWSKVIGPFFLYVNSGGDPAALARDARARQKQEAAKWPYAWVTNIDYAGPRARSTVQGRLVLHDEHASVKNFPRLLVGLTHATYPSPFPRPEANGVATEPRIINWQTDAKHYQFWVEGDEQGRFVIPQVPAGTYSLRALADGVLGEFEQAGVVVEAGKPLRLGELQWTPVRRGRPLWEIGIPNRNGSEFAGGDDFANPEISLLYAQRYPNDVNFVVGQSDFRRDWFFQQVPHNEDPNAKPSPYRGIPTPGRATPFTVHFDLDSPPQGTATLRLAICGTGTRALEVSVNNEPAGMVELGTPDGAITRHGIQGIWYERALAFPASLLRSGKNTLTLTVPAGPVNNGVIYDYVRLELDESAPRPVAQNLR